MVGHGNTGSQLATLAGAMGMRVIFYGSTGGNDGGVLEAGPFSPSPQIVHMRDGGQSAP